MATALTWADRLRIERALWTLDTYIQSLPGRSRRSIRRELRANLRACATDVGAAEAIRQLGGLHQLAGEYLDAEYGARPRPRVLKATFWTLAVEVVILCAAFVGHSGFVEGVEAANPHPDGTFTWHGLEVLGIGGEANYADGQLRSFGLSFNLLMLGYLVLAFLVGGRFWRLALHRWRPRRAARATRVAG